MHKDITASTLEGQGVNIRLSTVPDTCPRCHRNIQPNFVVAAALQGRRLSQAVFRCTNRKCQEIFIATYDNNESGHPQISQNFMLAPITAPKISLPETVTAISPSFVDIYTQANAAESVGLDQLVGIVLRKSLEFLIKDFAASEHPDSEEKIRKGLLAQCINTYITDSNVKECAKRAAWLGNDETHYTRKWDTKDISDLKLLVRLTINWIENSILTKKYIEDMGGA